jgi:hypothetical protein
LYFNTPCILDRYNILGYASPSHSCDCPKTYQCTPCSKLDVTVRKQMKIKKDQEKKKLGSVCLFPLQQYPPMPPAAPLSINGQVMHPPPIASPNMFDGHVMHPPWWQWVCRKLHRYGDQLGNLLHSQRIPQSAVEPRATFSIPMGIDPVPSPPITGVRAGSKNVITRGPPHYIKNPLPEFKRRSQTTPTS